ncbi:MAG: hypothetical protein AAF439_16565 [Pseudomonadota bacterium]
MANVVLRSFVGAMFPGLVVAALTVPVAALGLAVWAALQFFVLTVSGVIPIFGGLLFLIASLLLFIFSITAVWVQAARYAASFTGLQKISAQLPFWSTLGRSALVVILVQLVFAAFSVIASEIAGLLSTPGIGDASGGLLAQGWQIAREVAEAALFGAPVAIMAMLTMPLICDLQGSMRESYRTSLIIVRMLAGAAFFLFVDAVLNLIVWLVPPLPPLPPEVVEVLPLPGVFLLLALVFYFSMGFNLAFEGMIMKLTLKRQQLQLKEKAPKPQPDYRALQEQWRAQDRHR